ncbi:MAG: hypothetical protein ABIQ11_11780, partial [Saprospiraceae bacterium]
MDTAAWVGTEALIGTRFKSLDALKEVVQITYAHQTTDSSGTVYGSPYVRLIHRSGLREVTSILKAGISQTDFMHAKKGTMRDRVLLSLKSPYALINRKDLISVEHLGRREPELFGIGDAAFLDLAEIMDAHISEEDRKSIPSEDLSEKGYLNSFNHITAQALMTSLFSETLADFVADVHELYNMPELITGKFTDDQLAHPVDGPVDNYIDMINNEWGQELGKQLSEKYSIDRKTVWDPILLANYLNDIQNYCSWSLRVRFKPFKPT